MLKMDISCQRNRNSIQLNAANIVSYGYDQSYEDFLLLLVILLLPTSALLLFCFNLLPLPAAVIGRC
ncbi:hypothetical protein OWV82_015555 [Melia azedarach]|uniref:Uncharacterized protein n=2 Tax=Melia azedarach TaxID=155640 RepID=A0ACC1XQ59_MELAZ|nr:hypothetical protein OWV82_016540 [Melia azedarach]KAJ4713463.1 hypothetical protein OWV82_015555 [Melia azedarach]